MPADPAPPPDAAAVEAAARLIAGGRLVAFPTETVYGLGADATHEAAVAAIFAAKDRPRFNPLIVHFAEAEAARAEVVWNETAETLARRFWPGPLTLVLPRAAGTGLSLLVSAGLPSVGVRVPDHDLARDLLRRAGRPIAAPSANPSGGVSPTTAAHVRDGLGDAVATILDGGPCRIGLESTVLDLTGDEPALLRPGAVAEDEIAALIGEIATESHGDRPKSPGLLERHYAPGVPLRLDAQAAEQGETLLAFGPGAPDGAANLSPAGDLVEAAANLFAMLHALDRPETGRLAVMPIPERGLGRAINDRLRRGAHKG